VQNAPESGMRSGPGGHSHFSLDTFTHARRAGGIPQPRTLLTPTLLKRSQSFETSANCQAAGRTPSKGPAQVVSFEGPIFSAEPHPADLSGSMLQTITNTSIRARV
jgi:hypothetical protein